MGKIGIEPARCFLESDGSDRGNPDGFQVGTSPRQSIVRLVLKDGQRGLSGAEADLVQRLFLRRHHPPLPLLDRGQRGDELALLGPTGVQHPGDQARHEGGWIIAPTQRRQFGTVGKVQKVQKCVRRVQNRVDGRAQAVRIGPPQRLGRRRPVLLGQNGVRGLRQKFDKAVEPIGGGGGRPGVEQLGADQGGPLKNVGLPRPLVADVEQVDPRALLHAGAVSVVVITAEPGVVVAGEAAGRRHPGFAGGFLKQFEGLLRILDLHGDLDQGVAEDRRRFFLGFLAEARGILAAEAHREAQRAGLRGHHREALDRVVAVLIIEVEKRRRGVQRLADDHLPMGALQPRPQTDRQHGLHRGDDHFAQAGQLVGTLLQRRQLHQQDAAVEHQVGKIHLALPDPVDVAVHVRQLGQHPVELIDQVAVLHIGLRLGLGRVAAGADDLGGERNLRVLLFPELERLPEPRHAVQVMLEAGLDSGRQGEAVHLIRGAQGPVDQRVERQGPAQRQHVEGERLAPLVHAPVAQRHQHPDHHGQQADGLVLPGRRIAARLRHLRHQQLGQGVGGAGGERVEGVAEPSFHRRVRIHGRGAGQVVDHIQVILAPAGPGQREGLRPQRGIALGILEGEAGPPQQRLGRQPEHRFGLAGAGTAEDQQMGADFVLGHVQLGAGPPVVAEMEHPPRAVAFRLRSGLEIVGIGTPITVGQFQRQSRLEAPTHPDQDHSRQQAEVQHGRIPIHHRGPYQARHAQEARLAARALEPLERGLNVAQVKPGMDHLIGIDPARERGMGHRGSAPCLPVEPARRFTAGRANRVGGGIVDPRRWGPFSAIRARQRRPGYRRHRFIPARAVVRGQGEPVALHRQEEQKPDREQDGQPGGASRQPRRPPPRGSGQPVELAQRLSLGGISRQHPAMA